MGLFDWLFPGPEAKVRKARALLERGEYNEARWVLEGLEHGEARALRDQALAGMVELNLRAAEGAASLGDRALMEEHMELAREFGATPEQLRSLRRRPREERRPPPPPPEAPALEGDDPIWSLPPDDPRLRYAQIVESWPEALQPRLLALGADFAEACLAIEEGRAAESWERLAPYPARDPVAHFERARAALAMGRPGLAGAELQRLGERLGHLRVGNLHTAVLLSQILGQAGELDRALGVVDGALAATPTDVDLRFARANTLAGLGRWDEAEADASDVIRRAGKVMAAWRVVARARLGRGDRAGAAAALEGGLAACCSNPGKCGNQPLDLEATRMLARIYAEDGRETARVEELLGQLAEVQGGLEPEDEQIAALAGLSTLEPARA